MIDNPLFSFFPFDNKITEIRPNQILALNQIWDAIQNGKKKVILAAPVGSGKSAIGKTVMNYFESMGITSLYCSPLNSLVDQLNDSFCDVVTLKGKSHYFCIAKGNDIRCDSGYCANKICYLSRNAPKSERLKRDCKSCDLKGCICNSCTYKKVFRNYRSSVVGNTNASLWLKGVVPNDMKVLILDEADSLEDFVRMNYTVSVPYHIESKEFVSHIEAMTVYADKMESCLDCESGLDCTPRNHTRFKSMLDNIRNMTNDWDDYQEQWVIRKEVNKNGDLRTKYEPVTIERFTEPLLENLDFVLAMSATPPRWDGYTFIEVPSPFPIDIRQCYYHPLGRMSKDHRDENIPKLAEFLTTLKGKTVVHSVSYKNAEKIAYALRKLGVYPLLQVNGSHDKLFLTDYPDSNGDKIESVERWDAVRAFKASKKVNEILLSVNLDVGVDYWEPEIQNNVIAFMPFQNPTDLLTIAKDKIKGTSWENEVTAITIEQAHGRIHRGIFYLKDIVKYRPDLSWLQVNSHGMVVKRTFITDSNFENGKGRLTAWYSRNKRFFSQSFKEAMILNNSNY